MEQALTDVRTCIESRQPYDAVHHYRYTPLEKHPVWYAISGIPTFDKNGRMTNYFGIARNITFLMDAQERLKRETGRAEDSGRMKSAFLANMTHEIRTPLNAIVGFSDLLPVIDTQEERMEFIRIIRNNCDMLMRLINDILEASSMGQALAIRPAECDVSSVFDDICQTLAQRVQEPGVETAAYRKMTIAAAKKYGLAWLDLNGDDRTPAMIRSVNPDVADFVKEELKRRWAVDYTGSLTGKVNTHPNDAAHLYESYIIEAFLRSI